MRRRGAPAPAGRKGSGSRPPSAGGRFCALVRAQLRLVAVIVPAGGLRLSRGAVGQSYFSRLAATFPRLEIEGNLGPENSILGDLEETELCFLASKE